MGTRQRWSKTRRIPVRKCSGRGAAPINELFGRHVLSWPRPVHRRADRTSAALPQAFRPKFGIQMHGPSTGDQSGLRGKALLTVTMPGVPARVGLESVDRSPLRSINTIPWNDG
jgi:hypothetical protein